MRSATTRIDILSAAAPVAGQVLTATGDSAATWQTPGYPSNFKAWQNGNQAMAGTATTKVTLNAEVYDDNSDFDATTNYRFVAPVDGTYHFDASIGLEGYTARFVLLLYLDGAEKIRFVDANGISGTGSNVAGSTTLKMTAGQYVELFLYHAGAVTTTGQLNYTTLCGYRVK